MIDYRAEGEKAVTLARGRGYEPCHCVLGRTIGTPRPDKEIRCVTRQFRYRRAVYRGRASMNLHLISHCIYGSAEGTRYSIVQRHRKNTYQKKWLKSCGKYHHLIHPRYHHHREQSSTQISSRYTKHHTFSERRRKTIASYSTFTSHQ